MAQSQNQSRNRGLKLDTHPDPKQLHGEGLGALLRQAQNDDRPKRPPFPSSQPSQDTIRATATPPIEIPGTQDDSASANPLSSYRPQESYLDRFARDREAVLVTPEQSTSNSGSHRHSVHVPLKKTTTNIQRGRSLAQALHDVRPARAHSESDRSHYDPRTGLHLPQYSESPPREIPHVGEARFPLLQTTVDAMALESRTNIRDSTSMTSDSTFSPSSEAVMTPKDDEQQYNTSPINISAALTRALSSSYEPPRSGHRKASQRWRDGEAAQDLFTRAGSLRKGNKDHLRRSSRRDTASSTKSPGSAASFFLRGFSVSSGGDDSTSSAVDAEGSTIGEDYVIGKQIGFGGFSVIKEVTQMDPNTGQQRKLAVKIVKKQIANKSEAENEAAQAEFEHEVELWRRLNNRHILALEAVYELEEATFCFVPLNVGGTLFDLMRRNRDGLDPELVRNYAYQMCAALRYLHLDARVVHRDIKLENVLVEYTNDGEPGLIRLCDFGMAEDIFSDGDSTGPDSPTTSLSAEEQERRLSKFFGPAGSSTAAFAGGSLEYAAPEILRIATSESGIIHSYDYLPPEKSVVSTSIDVWSLGVCIYTMLMGRRPFANQFQPRVVMAILAGDWNKAGLRLKAGPVASQLVEMCLDMNPLRRPGISTIMEHKYFEEERMKAIDSDDDVGRGPWRL